VLGCGAAHRRVIELSSVQERDEAHMCGSRCREPRADEDTPQRRPARSPGRGGWRVVGDGCRATFSTGFAARRCPPTSVSTTSSARSERCGSMNSPHPHGVPVSTTTCARRFGRRARNDRGDDGRVWRRAAGNRQPVRVRDAGQLAAAARLRHPSLDQIDARLMPAPSHRDAHRSPQDQVTGEIRVG
jgi:hypothetical protein